MAICSVIDSNNSLGSNRFTVALHENKYQKGCLMVTFLHYCLSKTTSCASGSEKLLAMYQKSPPKVLY